MWTFLALPAAVLALAPTDEPIVTDRPDFTESAIVVPLKRLQLESGLTYQWAGGDRSLVLPEFLFRYGFDANWELRIGPPNYGIDWSGGSTQRGWGDLYLGVKRQLGPTPAGVDVAIILAAFVPTGNSGFSSRGVDPEIKFCVSKDLSEQGSLSGMIYVASQTDAGRRKEMLQTTLSYGHSLTERLGMFVEYAGTFGRHDPTEHLAHAGLVLRTDNDTQWDVHFGSSVTKPRRSFVAGGYSKRF